MPHRTNTRHNGVGPAVTRHELVIATPLQAELEHLCGALSCQWKVRCCSDAAGFHALPASTGCLALLVDMDILSQYGATLKQTLDEDLDIKTIRTEGMRALWQRFPNAHVVLLAREDKMREVVAAVKQGADNYLSYPIHPDEVRYVLESLEAGRRMESELSYLRENAWKDDAARFSHTASPRMREVLHKAKTAAPTSAVILLAGESGTGKTTLAKLIHAHSTRKDKPFVAVHCGAIPDTLAESELFGHEKGAFTGAMRRKLGKFEIAHGGTIFLDEVGALTPPTQIKLLQVLQEKFFQRVGGESDIRTDARVIAAANQDLRAMVQEGSFREDLYYRLNVFPIEIPPLRERKEDIPLLVTTCLEQLSREYGKVVRSVDPHALDVLTRYDWPGNVRELGNLVERAFILATSPILSVAHFPVELQGGLAHCIDGETFENFSSLTLAEARERAKNAVERQYLQDALHRCQGRINKTAEIAGLTPRQIHKLMSRHGLDKKTFR